MTLRLRVGVIAALALVLSGCSSEGTGQKQEEPDRLPDVTLASLTSGEGVDLASLRGPMVVNLWASWCTPCVRELPLYQAFAEKYDGKVDVVGIDWQDTNLEKARQLATRSGVEYPLYADPDGKIRARGLPKLILLDDDGAVAFEQYVEIESVAQIEKLVEEHLGVSS